MSFNGLGVFVVNSAGNPVVSGTTISSSGWANPLTADLATGLSTCILKDGTQTITANVPWGGFKITGLAAGTILGDAIGYGQANASLVTPTLSSPTFTGTVTFPGASTWTSSGITGPDASTWTSSGFAGGKFSAGFTGFYAGTDYISINDSVGGSAIRSMSVRNASSNASAGAVVYVAGNTSVGRLFASSSNNGIFGVLAASEVGLENTAGPVSLTATGTVYARSGGSGGAQITSGATSWGSSSDLDKKTDLEPILSAVEKLRTLRTVTGRFKTDPEEKRRLFLIWQDVNKVLPEVTSVSEDGTLLLHYSEMIPAIIAAINELSEAK